MQPLFNSFPPKLFNQIQSNGNTASVNPQVFSENPNLSNLCNMLQYSMPMQPQMGIVNHQSSIPINNSNAHLINGQVMSNMPAFMTHQLAHMNTLNHLGIPQMDQCHTGFSLQNHVNNLNSVPTFVNQVNPFQQGQVCALSFSNLAPQHNQNMCFPNLQNPMQTLNHNGALQMQHPSHSAPYHFPTSSQQMVGPQNLNFLANPSFGVGQQVNQHQQNFVVPIMGTHESKPLAVPPQQVQGNLSTLPQIQKSVPSAFIKLQGNYVKNGQTSTSNSNWKKFHGKEFKKNSMKEASQLRCHRMNKGKRKFEVSKEHQGKGHGFEEEAKFCGNYTDQRERKRPSVTYTEQEIKQWCEERRRNYPSKSNIDKKQAKMLTDSDAVDREAKFRRKQLEEILAKQAELGVEVAEIPSHYLSDPKQVHGKEDANRKPLSKKRRLQNKYDKRGRYNKKAELTNQHILVDKDSSNIASFHKKKETLLCKLLNADIRRDKCRLLQVFRFMAMNSFFKNFPETPLKFPVVVVKEDEEMADEKTYVSRVSNETTVENVGDDKDDNNHDAQVKEGTCSVKERGGLAEEFDRAEEEEGEIID